VNPPQPTAELAPVLAVRAARPADAEAIRTIYNHEVLSTTATFDLVPRSLDDQQQWLAARSGAFTAIVVEDLATANRTGEAHGAAAIETSGEVVGFAALSPYRERAAYRTSVEDSVYVRRDRAGQGIGTLLLRELLDIAEGSGFHAVFARIEASGEASRALHSRCGFELVGVERETGRKFNRWLDVALMQCLLHERHRR
jgi:L-amino acid N-acyltransferase